MIKQELRQIYKDKRAQLTVAEKLKLDDLLLIQLQRLPLSFNIRVLLTFWAIEDRGEVNAQLFTRYLQHVFPHIKTAFPVTDNKPLQMHARLADEETKFIENEYDIPEPANGQKILPSHIDIVFVPLLAFDKKGFRVGYGKGFYDRFLAQCREDVLTIGFSWFEAVDQIDDTHEFDIPLSCCITPQQIYEF